MSINRDKSEIAESFKHLLRKADEMALDKKKDDLIDKFNLEENDKNQSEINNNQSRIFLTDIAKKINPNLEDLKLKKDIADPQRYWLKNEMSNVIKEVFKSKRFKNRNLFEIDLLNQDFNLFCDQKKEFHSLIFFNIFILEIWLRYYIDLPLSKANEYQKLSDFIKETNN